MKSITITLEADDEDRLILGFNKERVTIIGKLSTLSYDINTPSKTIESNIEKVFGEKFNIFGTIDLIYKFRYYFTLHQNN